MPLPTSLDSPQWRKLWLGATPTLMALAFNIFVPVDQRKTVGFTVDYWLFPIPNSKPPLIETTIDVVLFLPMAVVVGTGAALLLLPRYAAYALSIGVSFLYASKLAQWWSFSGTTWGTMVFMVCGFAWVMGLWMYERYLDGIIDEPVVIPET